VSNLPEPPDYKDTWMTFRAHQIELRIASHLRTLHSITFAVALTYMIIFTGSKN
jgi:hypothetical protein